MTREERIEQLQRRIKVLHEAYKDAACADAAARMQRTKAIRCLLQIIDGPDRERAITDARAWLVRFCKDERTFRLMSEIENHIIPATLAELEAEVADWPEEIEVTR